MNLPCEVEAVLREFFTCEFSTLNHLGQPITWPTLAYYDTASGRITTSASIAFPVKALNARRNPRVSLLFSDPTGCRLVNPPAVLVQGDATVTEAREMTPEARGIFELTLLRQPQSRQFISNPVARSLFSFYFWRLLISVRPLRILVWHGRDFDRVPDVLEVANVG